ncbi:MAG: aspartate kinase [Rhodovulum sp.]|nr:aspartate kinase [Rhodovulum sp.]
MTHTVEKIGGTSMSRLVELRDTLFLNRDAETPYGHIFVVSAFGGITDLLLEHKKTGNPGVYALFRDGAEAGDWRAALNAVAATMIDTHSAILTDEGDIQRASTFVTDRVAGLRDCLDDFERLRAHGHFRLDDQFKLVREMLSGLGEAHSAFVASLYLGDAGLSTRFVDLSGWDNGPDLTLDQRIQAALSGVNPARELPIVTGYTKCRRGLMTEFDRGYSEVTFAKIAVHSAASEAIIHKEFHLSSADPKLVGTDAVHTIGHTNYDVADQLSNMGMEAIHPKAAKMLRQAGIPLRVTNAFDHGNPGTVIDDTPAPAPRVDMVTGLNVQALELFEPDMVGVKGYDAALLDILTRHDVRIVAKTSNANTITHYVDSTPERLARVEQDIVAQFPGANFSQSELAVVAVIGRDLGGLRVLTRGLVALETADVVPVAVQQTTRNVDAQFIVPRTDKDRAITALHETLVEQARAPLRRAA